jgi:IS30 family transposase
VAAEQPAAVGDGRRAHSVQQIADEFGVTRPTIYRHLQRHTDWPDLSRPTCRWMPRS